MESWDVLPGETPIDDISGLKVKGVSTRGELIVLEAANIRKVLVKYLGKKPSRRSARFDYSWSLRLHREMFGDVWRWAGKTRTCDLNLGVPWQQVEQRLYTLLGNLAYREQGEMEMLAQAVLLHHEAVSIHPFMNGNGRWARMLANIWLKLHGQPVTLWPEEAVGGKSPVREEYLSVIQQADEGEYGPLTDLHRRFTAPAVE